MLRATDYLENDKILTLLTAEKGKITAGIKGVKKAGAKLKFAAQPFFPSRVTTKVNRSVENNTYYFLPFNSLYNI